MKLDPRFEKLYRCARCRDSGWVYPSDAATEAVKCPGCNVERPPADWQDR